MTSGLPGTTLPFLSEETQRSEGTTEPCDGSRNCQATTHIHGCFAEALTASEAPE